MKPAAMYIPQNIPDLVDLLASMLLSAPKFMDKTGYLPFLNLDFVFQELHAGLDHNRKKLGEEHYHRLNEMSDQMRALFEADPEDKTGETLQGRKIIAEMRELLREIRRKPKSAR